MVSKIVKDDDGHEKKTVEAEIQELQRKFRVLENDKRAYSEDSQGIIRSSTPVSSVFKSSPLFSSVFSENREQLSRSLQVRIVK